MSFRNACRGAIHVGFSELSNSGVARSIQPGPLRAPHPVQHMPPQRMTRLDIRVIEIVGWITRHADALHDSSRAHVQRDGERDNLLKCQLLEAEPQALGGCLTGVTVTPVFLQQSPSNFNARTEVRLDARYRQPNEPDEGRATAHLDRPETPTSFLDGFVDACGIGITFLTGLDAGEEFPDDRVRVESRKGIPVRLLPLPENQSFGG